MSSRIRETKNKAFESQHMSDKSKFTRGMFFRASFLSFFGLLVLFQVFLLLTNSFFLTVLLSTVAFIIILEVFGDYIKVNIMKMEDDTILL